MIKEILNREEKKVEYIELIYDLIFVYILGRSNGLLHHIEDGFITADTYFTFILTTLIILQIWFFTTLFINRYGANGAAEYAGLFVSMYLLYYMAQGTGHDWREHYTQFNLAWALILLNLAAQYLLKLIKCPGKQPLLRRHIMFYMILLTAEAALVLISIPVFNSTGLGLSPIAMAAGTLIVVTVGVPINRSVPVDFPHLSERVMLYVVFTFGEMIISIASYFEGGLEFNSIYFSLMGFLIVAGLFFIYGYFYDRVIDREYTGDGTAYMLIHILLLTMLNNITVALEYMREPQVSEVPKNAFLVASFVLYFAFLFLALRYAKKRYEPKLSFFAVTGGLTAGFVVMMAMFYRNSMVSIAATVIYIYAMLMTNVIYGKRAEKKAGSR